MFKFDRPTLVTLTAPTCSGKSHLLNALTAEGRFSRIVSTTTRSQRPGEVDGVDYHFIDVETSRKMEANGEFFELITFNGTRYGVTNDEMTAKMTAGSAPIVILEPQGLEIYERECRRHGWDIFKIYVHVTEKVQLERLLHRSLQAAWRSVDSLSPSPGRYTQTFFESGSDEAKKVLAHIINEHQRRLLSITGDERRWLNMFTWDAIVPGDSVEKAAEMIGTGIKWRNRKAGAPVAVGAVRLPL